MAPRDRNLFAWQAYVIAMSFVVLALIVALGWTLASYSNIERQRDEAQNKATTAADAHRKLSEEVQLFKGMLGQQQFTEAEWGQLESSASSDEQKKLQDQYKKDMSLFGPNEPLQNKNYPKLSETLMRELRDRNLQIDAANRSQAELVKKTESTIQNETKAREAAEAKADSLEKELETARIDFQAKLDEGQKIISQVNETLQKSNAAHAKEKAKLEALVKEKTQRADELVSLNMKLKKRLMEVEGEEFQAAQGMIVNVAEGGNVVYINLGSADNLRTGVKFGIIDPQETRLKDAKPKAHLEIAEILGPNLSRGKVISGDLQVPVIIHDLVYSLVWQKGRKTRFALMGKMDMNGDGLDDREALKEMILQSGGEISEDLGPDGKASGQMTVDTNWLIVGEGYKVTANEDLDPRQRDFRQKYADMQQRAKELAVSQINLDKVLVWLQNGGQSDRTVPLGNASRADDFRDQRRLPSSSGSVSDLYQKKRLEGAFGAPAGDR
jgi:hypothetical protein